MPDSRLLDFSPMLLGTGVNDQRQPCCVTSVQ